MTNKLVVIINRLKYQKLRNFTIWIEISCTKLQLPPEPLTRGLPPPDSRYLCPLSSTEFVEPPPEQNSWVRHCFEPSAASSEYLNHVLCSLTNHNNTGIVSNGEHCLFIRQYDGMSVNTKEKTIWEICFSHSGIGKGLKSSGMRHRTDWWIVINV